MRKRKQAANKGSAAANDEQRKINAKAELMPSVNAASVIKAYQGNILGDEFDLKDLVDGLRGTFENVEKGDLSRLEGMLIAQATALQTIFTSLARRAQVQQYQRNLEAFLGLALKAQAQSRATIQAIAELKYPKQVAFVKQANISHGPQQVNNGCSETSTRTHAHAGKNQTEQNKLIEDGSDGRTYLNTGAETKAGGSDPALEAVGEIHRAEKRGR
jgi:hypothetical protein